MPGDNEDKGGGAWAPMAIETAATATLAAKTKERGEDQLRGRALDTVGDCPSCLFLETFTATSAQILTLHLQHQDKSTRIHAVNLVGK